MMLYVKTIPDEKYNQRKRLYKTQQISLHCYDEMWCGQRTCPAVGAHPAVQAHLGSRGLAAVVAKVVVAGNTQLVALVAVVVLVAAHPYAVDDAAHRSVVGEGLPGLPGVQHARVSSALNEQLLPVCKDKTSEAVSGTATALRDVAARR